MASRHFLLRDKVLRQVLLLIIEAIWQCSEEISVKLLPSEASGQFGQMVECLFTN